jgi:hypothetical protein
MNKTNYSTDPTEKQHKTMKNISDSQKCKRETFIREMYLWSINADIVGKFSALTYINTLLPAADIFTKKFRNTYPERILQIH